MLLYYKYILVFLGDGMNVSILFARRCIWNMIREWPCCKLNLTTRYLSTSSSLGFGLNLLHMLKKHILIQVTVKELFKILCSFVHVCSRF